MYQNFAASDAELLECQHCKEHFCIKCLKKSNTEYDVLSKSDTMWFCVKCRKIVEEHIVIDLKIEERCKEIMENYEQRISDIEIVKEELQLNSCNEPMVKKIVEEVITGEGQNLQSEILARERQPKKETVSTVIDELNDRKTREKNVLIFGLKENVSEILQEREGRDIENILQLFKDAKITLEQENTENSET